MPNPHIVHRRFWLVAPTGVKKASRQTTRPRPRRWVLSPLLALIVVGFAVPSPLATAATPRAKSVPHALVLSAGATPQDLPPGGGTIAVIGEVRHATACQLQLLTPEPFRVVYSHDPTSGCMGGDYVAHVTIGANTSQAERVVGFALVARNGSSSFSGKFFVGLAGAPSPVVSWVGVSPAAVASPGGDVTISASLKHATSCQLRLLSSQSFPVVYASNIRPCSSTLIAHIVIGPNPSQVPRTVAFDLLARNKTAAVARAFYVVLAAPVAPAATTTVPAATTTAPAATTTVPAATTTVPAATTTLPSGLAQFTSDNWSGYGVTGGPFTVVKGTFTVPYISDVADCTDDVSTWVGIDGYDTPTLSDTSLIQAGVDASDTDPATGQCTPGSFYTWSWWEVLPAPETRWAISVHGGDQVTVEIWQISLGDWGIQMTDDATGQTDETTTRYDGPGETAEWIVEAAQNTKQCGDGVDPTTSAGICQLASYTDANGDQPGVSFSNLGLTGNVVEWDETTMVQYGVAVSTPSQYETNGNGVSGFTVSYTGDEQASLRPAIDRRLPEGRFLRQIYAGPASGAPW